MNIFVDIDSLNYLLHRLERVKRKIIYSISNIDDWKIFVKGIDRESEIIIFKYSSSSTVSFVIEKIFDKWFNNLPNDLRLNCFKIDELESKL